MSWLETYGWRLIFVIFYLAMLARHCLAGNRETKNLSDFLIAGRSLNGWIVAMSFYATFVSTNSFIGQAGKSWDVGLIWYIKALVFGVLCYVSWYFVAPRFFHDTRSYGSLTIPDFLGARYQSEALRRTTAIVILFASGLYLVAVYKGSSLALQQFLGLSYSVSAVIIFLIVTAYTLAGGFRSVVLTDAFQGVIMAVGAVLMITVLIVKGGGLSAMLENIHDQDPALVSWQGKMPLFSILGLALAGGLKLLVEPRQLSRYYGLRDLDALRTARIIAPLLILVTYLCLMPVGVLAHAIIPEAAISDSDNVVPYLLGSANLLGPVLSSLFLLVLFSAAMSSLDSVLLVAASSVSRDLLLLKDDESKAILHTRIWIMVLSLTSMLLALNPFADIVEITAFSGSLYATCFLPTLVLGLYWKNGTAGGSLSCVVGGTLTVVLWFLAKRNGWTDIHEVYVGFVVGLVLYLTVPLLDRST